MKKFKALIILFLGIILAFGYSNCDAAEKNSVKNSGFETLNGNKAADWDSYSWQDKGIFNIDNKNKYSGDKSISITNNEPSDSRYKQVIAVKANSYYKLSCYIKTSGVGINNKGANLSIENLLSTSKDITGTTDWKYVEVYGQTDKNQNTFTLTIGLGGYGSLNTGTAWFDDVNVEKVDTVPASETVIKLYKENQTSNGASTYNSNKNSVNTNNNANVSKNNMTNITLIFLGALFVLAILILYFFIKGKEGILLIKNKNSTHLTGNKLIIEKRDFSIIAFLTIVYCILALINLGSLNVPQTAYKPLNAGESFIVDFKNETDISKLYYYCGLDKDTKGKLDIQYLNDAGQYVPYSSIEKKNIFIWKTIDTPDIKVQKLKFTVVSPGFTINEIAFFEKGSPIPIKDFNVTPLNEASAACLNLFDEQNKVDYKHSFMSGMIFDEIYHARTAYEFLHNIEPYEWTHPPLGKLFISVGIFLFGMNPFGWRIVGTLFGVAMIPIMYLFGKKMFKDRFYAICTALLMMFDFMHFSLSRIATIDVYGCFFVILMYYFMYDYFSEYSFEKGFKNSLKPLLFCGICFGFGAASKWIGLYAGGGLALLFFMQKYFEYKQYKIFKIHNKNTIWLKDYIPVYLNKTLIYCVLFFVLIPVGIYILSYIPYMNAAKQGLDLILRNQRDMFVYHSSTVLGATHPFSSQWFEWPIIKKPLETYAASDLPQGISSTMTIMGNPLIWWSSIPALAAAIFIAIKNKEKNMIVIFTAIAFQYLPWIGIKRVAFIYHFFSTTPFLILSIVYVLKYLNEKYSKARYFIYGYLILALLLFIMFYPVLSGMEVSKNYVESYLRWFKTTWFF